MEKEKKKKKQKAGRCQRWCSRTSASRAHISLASYPLEYGHGPPPQPDRPIHPAEKQNARLFSQLFMLLSRACLGKMIGVFCIEWRKQWRFPHRAFADAWCRVDMVGVLAFLRLLADLSVGRQHRQQTKPIERRWVSHHVLCVCPEPVLADDAFHPHTTSS
jgi:hypothetical protein